MIRRFDAHGAVGRHVSPFSVSGSLSLCLVFLLSTLSVQAQVAQDWVDVSAYQTGGVNDITAIQNAIDSLSGDAGTLYFPEGEYDLYSGLATGDDVLFCAPNVRFAFHDRAMLLVGNFSYNFDIELVAGARPLFDVGTRSFGTLVLGGANTQIFPQWFGVVADDDLPDNQGFQAALETLRHSPGLVHCNDITRPRRISTQTLVIPGGQYILDADEFGPEDERIALDLRPFFKSGWTIPEREKHTKGLEIDAQNALFTLKGDNFVAIQMGFHTKLNGSISLEWEDRDGDNTLPDILANGVTGVRFGKSGDLNTGAYIEHILVNDCAFGMVFTVDGCEDLRQIINGNTEFVACGTGCPEGQTCEIRCNSESGVYYNHVNHARLYRCGTGLLMRTSFSCNEENGKAARVNANHFDFLDVANSVQTGIEMDWANSNSFGFLELERNGMIVEGNSERGRGLWLKGQVSGVQVTGGWIEKNGWAKDAGTDREVNIQVAPGSDVSGLQVMARMTGMYKDPSSIDGAEGLGIFNDGSTLFMPNDTQMGSVRLNEARDMRSIRSDNGLNVVLRNRRNMEVQAEGDAFGTYLMSVDSSEKGHVSRGVHIPELMGESLLKPGRYPLNPTVWMPDFRWTLSPEATHLIIQDEEAKMLFRLRQDSGALYLPGNLSNDGGVNFRVGKGIHESYRFVVREYGSETFRDGDPLFEIDKSGMSIGQGTPIKKHMHEVLSDLTMDIAVDDIHIQAVTVTGAKPGDTVAVGLEGALGGLLISGSVVADDTVHVTIFNKRTSPFQPSGISLKVDVWQH